MSPTHTCPARGCSRRVPQEELACPTHWSKLPWRMRTNLSRAFRDHDYAGHNIALDAALQWYATNDADASGEAKGGFTTTSLDPSGGA